jgi:hypothetical protein
MQSCLANGVVSVHPLSDTAWFDVRASAIDQGRHRHGIDDVHAPADQGKAVFAQVYDLRRLLAIAVVVSLAAALDFTGLNSCHDALTSVVVPKPGASTPIALDRDRRFSDGECLHNQVRDRIGL